MKPFPLWPLLLTAAVLIPGAARAQSSTEVLPKKAVCPVDSKSVEVTPQSLHIYVNGKPKFFCGTACRDKFVSRPEGYVREAYFCAVQPSIKSFIIPTRRIEVNNNLYYVCCDPCVQGFRREPFFFVKETVDPVSNKWFKPAQNSPKSVVKEQIFLFESPEDKAAFEKEPEKYILPYRK